MGQSGTLLAAPLLLESCWIVEMALVRHKDERV